MNTPNPNPSPELREGGLLACPFCGSQNVAPALLPEDVGYRGSVQCSNCWARGPRTYVGDWCAVLIQAGTGRPDRDEMGAAGWNTRALSQALPAPGEVERAAVVAYIRRQSDRGADIGNEKPKGSTARAAFGGGSLALKRVADNIETGEHILNDNALPATVAAANDEGVVEQAAQFADGVADGAQSLYALAARDRDTVGTLIHGEAVRVAKHIASAIRLLSQGGGK